MFTSECPSGVFFSAIMVPDILDLMSKFMRNPARILIKKDELTLEGIL